MPIGEILNDIRRAVSGKKKGTGQFTVNGQSFNAFNREERKTAAGLIADPSEEALLLAETGYGFGGAPDPNAKSNQGFFDRINLPKFSGSLKVGADQAQFFTIAITVVGVVLGALALTGSFKGKRRRRR